MFPSAYPPLPPLQPSSCSSSCLSYKDPFPRMISKDPTLPRYQTEPPMEWAPSPPPEGRVPSP
jgi:hypothetical protein